MPDPKDDKRWTERSPYKAAVSDEAVDRERHFAPSAARNAGPIVEVLRTVLPEAGRALEIASGTGQHVVAFARAFPGIDWQPSDPEPQARASIAAWVAEAGVANVRPALDLDMTRPDWDAGAEGPLEAIVCINMVHISPWAACQGLIQGAGRLLGAGGLLYLYGPYKRGGRHTAPSNEEFDRSLRQRNPTWGVRDVDDVAACARARGLVLAGTVDMPANNLSVIFRRAG